MIEEKLSKGYVWEKQWARRERRKGRASGGMLMGIRKDIMVEGNRGKEAEEKGKTKE